MSKRAAEGDSPDGLTVGQEERPFLRQVLRQAGIRPTTEVVEQLIKAVQESMDKFQQAVPEHTYRDLHDEIRALLRLAEANDPPIGEIRRRLAKLPDGVIDEAAIRAHRLWPRVFCGESLGEGSTFAPGCRRRRARSFWRRC